MATSRIDADLSFENFYRDTVETVWSFAARRVGAEEAKDVVAETYTAAVVAVREGKSAAVTLPWLITVCRNKIIDRWRKAERHKSRMHLVAEAFGNGPMFPDDWHHDDRRDAVLATLDRLNARQRALLVLHHVDGMSARSLADESGVSQKAVESALVRARRSFRREYEEVTRET